MLRKRRTPSRISSRCSTDKQTDQNPENAGSRDFFVKFSFFANFSMEKQKIRLCEAFPDLTTPNAPFFVRRIAAESAKSICVGDQSTENGVKY